MDAKLTLTPPINDCDSISSPLLSELLLLFPVVVDEKSEPRESPKPPEDDAEGFQDEDMSMVYNLFTIIYLLVLPSLSWYVTMPWWYY